MTWPLDVFEAALRDAFQFASEDKGADLSGKRKLAGLSDGPDRLIG